MKKCKSIIKKINHCFNHKIKITDEIIRHLKGCKRCYDYYFTYLNLICSLKKDFEKKMMDFNSVALNSINRLSQRRIKKNKIFITLIISFLVIFISFLIYKNSSPKNQYISTVEVMNDFTFDNVENFLLSPSDDWFSNSITEEILLEETLNLN